MNKIIVVGVLLALTAMCAGCSTVNSDGSVSQAHPLLGTKELQLTSAFALRPEFIVAGVAFLVVTDPLAPTWKIRQSEPAPGEFHLEMRKKAFTNDAGGDGEARQVFLRRAAALAKEHGLKPTFDEPGYTVLAFDEGVESEVPFAHRVAYGVVKVGAQR